MISSAFFLDILDLLLDGDEWGQAARPQLDYLTIKDFEHTGVGMFVGFGHKEGIENHKIRAERLDGVYIYTPEIEGAAQADVVFTDGLIDHLEIWCHEGGDYPSKDPVSYTLRQEGTWGTGRTITRP